MIIKKTVTGKFSKEKMERIQIGKTIEKKQIFFFFSLISVNLLDSFFLIITTKIGVNFFVLCFQFFGFILYLILMHDVLDWLLILLMIRFIFISSIFYHKTNRVKWNTIYLKHKIVLYFLHRICSFSSIYIAIIIQIGPN